MNINTRTYLSRILEAIILAAVAGVIAYGLTIWLAPQSSSAKLVGTIVAAISALACLLPSAILETVGRRESDPSAVPDIYYEATFGAHKDEGWND